MKEAITPKFIPQFKSKTSSFKTPVRATSIPTETTPNESEEKDSSNDVTCYYSVMWYVQHLRSLCLVWANDSGGTVYDHANGSVPSRKGVEVVKFINRIDIDGK